VHKAGRLAQAGQAGHALLFLLPSERQYVEVLELRSLRDISLLFAIINAVVGGGIVQGLDAGGRVEGVDGEL
jgi:hypothetical protein